MRINFNRIPSRENIWLMTLVCFFTVLLHFIATHFIQFNHVSRWFVCLFLEYSYETVIWRFLIRDENVQKCKQSILIEFELITWIVYTLYNFGENTESVNTYPIKAMMNPDTYAINPGSRRVRVWISAWQLWMKIVFEYAKE